MHAFPGISGPAQQAAELREPVHAGFGKPRFVKRMVVLLVCLGALAGCGDSLVAFRVVFDEDSDQERARAVELVALVGGCESTEVAYRWALDRDTTPESADLPDGRYGIRASAVDATCTRFAAGCVDVQLPATDEVLVTLSAEDALYTCGDETCSDGRCDAERPVGQSIAMGLGEGETCSVSSEGGLLCWGSNEEGQLGLSAMPDVLVPTQVESPERFVSVDLGYQNTCALTREGVVQCAGLNRGGAAGTGGRAPQPRFAPVASDVRFSSVTTGYGHTCAIAEDSSLYCWGLCCDQLGQGARDEDVLVPTRISTGWAQVSAGGYEFGGPGALGGHACAIRTDGSLWCWGGNAEGQLGVSDRANRAEPTEVRSPAGPWAQVQAGGDFTCAIRYDATLWCWGNAANGALGLGNGGEDQLVPAEHVEGEWRTLGTSARSACAIRRDGSMWCWGNNETQQLGQPTMQGSVGASSPLPTHSETEWTHVFGGQRHLCAFDADGDIFCWGDNRNRELGGSSMDDATAFPTRVALP